MGKDFETHHDATVGATPQQIWDAIATGPGISATAPPPPPTAGSPPTNT